MTQEEIQAQLRLNLTAEQALYARRKPGESIAYGELWRILESNLECESERLALEEKVSGG